MNTTVGAGAVTAVAIGNSAGTGYKVGDTITVSGGGGNATLTVDEVRSLLPVVGDGVKFSGLDAGDIIPIYVDYVLSSGGTTATLLVAGRESSM